MATWLKARQATITINAITYDTVEASYSEDYNEFDCTPITGGTNGAGALADQWDVDTIATSLNATFIVDSAAIKTLKGGRKYAASYTSADGDVHAGTWIGKQRGKAISTKGAYKVALQGKFTDVVSGQ